MHTANALSVAEAEAWCNAQATCEGFTFDNKRQPVQMLFHDGMASNSRRGQE